jgi:hypothetical protein
MQPIKIEPRTRTMRCQKCWRLHDLEYLLTNDVITVGYRCHFHKKAAAGAYYVAKLGIHNGLSLPFKTIEGSVRELKQDWYEVIPLPVQKTKITLVQEQFSFI